MKIAYIINSYPIHVVVEDEMVELIKRNHDISIFCIFDSKISLSKIDEIIKSRLFELGDFIYWQHFLLYLIRKPKKLLRFLSKWRNLLGIIGSIKALWMSDMFIDLEIDRIHCEFVSVNALYAMVISKEIDIPFSCTTHHSDLLYKPLENLQEVIAEARPFITISQFNREYIKEKYGDVYRRVDIVRCGVDTNLYHFPERRSNVGIPVITTVSWFRPVKALDVLARALVILDREGIDFFCKVIGGGDDGRDDFIKILSEANIENRFELLGVRPRDEVMNILIDSDIFVLPSISEGVPVAIMEAMALELPVVASRIMGNLEIVEDGRTGFLVPERDPDALALKLKELIKDEGLRKLMGERGREVVLREYNLEKNVSILEKTFQKY